MHDSSRVFEKCPEYADKRTDMRFFVATFSLSDTYADNYWTEWTLLGGADSVDATGVADAKPM